MLPVFSLTTTDKEFFTTNGWLLTEPLSAQDVDKIQESVSAIH
jgi:hypothetical protein